MSARTRDYVYIPFDTMMCPVTGDVEGSVPGIKRRVLAKWGRDRYESITWPPLRTVSGMIENLAKMDEDSVNMIGDRYGLPRSASLEEIAQAVVGSASAPPR